MRSWAEHLITAACAGSWRQQSRCTQARWCRSLLLEKRGKDKKVRGAEQFCLAAWARRADKPHICTQLGGPGWPRWSWSLTIPEAATAEDPTGEEAAGLSTQKTLEPKAAAVEEMGENWPESCLFTDTTSDPSPQPKTRSIYVGMRIFSKLDILS